MSEQQDERISERRLGQEEEQETLYSTASYDALDPEKEGRWFVHEGKALVWTDDEGGAGIAWTGQTPDNQRIWKHFQVSKLANVPAGVAYQLAMRSLPEEPEEQGGTLDQANDAFENLMHGG